VSLKEELRHLTNQTKINKFSSGVIEEALHIIYTELRLAAKEGEDYAEIAVSTPKFNVLSKEDKREAILIVVRQLKDEGLMTSAIGPAPMMFSQSDNGLWMVKVYWGDDSDGN
jgi:hypothetical protein